MYAEALDVEYKNSVKEYTDNAKQAAIKTSSTEIKNTAEELKLIAKGIKEDNTHNYVDNPKFSGNFGEDNFLWGTNTSNNTVITDTTLGRCVKLVRYTDPSYIYINVGKLAAGTYRVTYKAATIKGQEPRTTTRASFRSATITSQSGQLKSDEWTTIEKDITITEANSNILYIYANSMNSTLLVADVKVLGLLSVYTETQVRLRDELIELEAKRAETAEGELRASIAVNAESITSCVTKDNVSSYIKQYYDKVIVAFNDNSKYVQIKAGEIAIYDGAIEGEKLRSKFDQNGNGFWRDGYYVGKIGTNQWNDDKTHKGLVFDLELQGKYMAWARKTNTSDGYDVVLCYSRENSIYSDEGLHFGVDVYAHRHNLLNANLVNASVNGFIGQTKNIPIVTSIVKNDNGSITWNSSYITVRGGLVTAVPANAEDI